MQNQDSPKPESAQAFLLRPYQQRAVEWAKTGADGLIIAPAGSGKTLIASSIIKHYAKDPMWSFGWLAPTRETCQQAYASLKAVGVDVDRVDIRCPHESVDFSSKKLVIIDEAKHAPATTWRRIIESTRGLRYGFDATPWCDDPERNEILRKLFRDTQFEIRREELAGVLAHSARGHLCGFRTLAGGFRADTRPRATHISRGRHCRLQHLRHRLHHAALARAGLSGQQQGPAQPSEPQARPLPSWVLVPCLVQPLLPGRLACPLPHHHTRLKLHRRRRHSTTKTVGAGSFQARLRCSSFSLQ